MLATQPTGASLQAHCYSRIVSKEKPPTLLPSPPMTTLARFAAASCCLALAASIALAAQEAKPANPPDIVIERAPESAETVLRRENAALRARVAELEVAVKSAGPEQQEKRAALQALADQLTARNQELETTLQTRTAELQQLQSRLAELSAETAKHADIATQSAAEKTRADEAVKQAFTLQAELDRLRAERQDWELQLTAARTNESAMKEQLAAAEKAQAAPVTDLSAKLTETEAKLADTTTKLETALRSYSLAQAENERLTTAGATQADVEAELTRLRQQNAELESRLAATPPPPPDLTDKLAQTEDKLNTVLRSYTLLERETDQAKTDAARAAEQAQAAANRAAAESAAQISALFDELRQTQAQVASLAAENSQLKTRLAVVGPSPGSTLATPSRPTAAPAAAPESTSASAPAEPRLHVVVPGDNLAKISRNYYGTANRWDEILAANRDVIQNENVLPIGATLRIP